MKAIRHTGIVVSDLKRALHFYGRLLGLNVVKRSREEESYIEKICGIKKGRLTTVKMSARDGSLVELLHFSLHPNSPKKRKFYKTGVSHVAFTVNDVDAEYKRLLNAGIKFNSPPQVSPDGYAKVVLCRDYDHNPVELVQEL